MSINLVTFFYFCDMYIVTPYKYLFIYKFLWFCIKFVDSSRATQRNRDGRLKPGTRPELLVLELKPDRRFKTDGGTGLTVRRFGYCFELENCEQACFYIFFL